MFVQRLAAVVIRVLLHVSLSFLRRRGTVAQAPARTPPRCATTSLLWSAMLLSLWNAWMLQRSRRTPNRSRSPPFEDRREDSDEAVLAAERFEKFFRRRSGVFVGACHCPCQCPSVSARTSLSEPFAFCVRPGLAGCTAPGCTVRGALRTAAVAEWHTLLLLVITRRGCTSRWQSLARRRYRRDRRRCAGRRAPLTSAARRSR